MERVRCCIDQTALKLQVQLIHGTTSVPRILKDILIFLCSFLFLACGLGDRSYTIKPVTNTPPQPYSLVPPYFLHREERRLLSEERIDSLTLTLLTWTKWGASASASKWQMGFNSAFKGLSVRSPICAYCEPR